MDHSQAPVIVLHVLHIRIDMRIFHITSYILNMRKVSQNICDELKYTSVCGAHGYHQELGPLHQSFHCRLSQGEPPSIILQQKIFPTSWVALLLCTSTTWGGLLVPDPTACLLHPRHFTFATPFLTGAIVLEFPQDGHDGNL